MIRILVSWIGRSDLKAAHKNDPADDPGPILRLLRTERFDEIHLLNDVQPGDAKAGEASPEGYRAWLCAQLPDIPAERQPRLYSIEENLHNRYDLAYRHTCEQLTQIRDQPRSEPPQFALLLSPGYPAALVALILVQQTLLNRETQLFLTSPDKGVEQVKLPFFLSVDVVPAIQRQWQQSLSETAAPAFESIVGRSRAILLAKQMAQTVAMYADTSVIVRGETGTGKELFAQAIHESSPRHDKPFKPVNCAAIPRELLQSELFGHVKGAFTGANAERRGLVAEAEGGTLFLDEIGDMDLDLQAKLLRFLQERKYSPVGTCEEKSANVRILAATHQDLERAVEAGRFRADLYYRLNGVTIHLPPLRERGQDVRELAAYLLERWNRDNHAARHFADEAIVLLGRYPWRGNVRELQNAVGRLAMFCATDTITLEDVDCWLGTPSFPPNAALCQQSPRAFLSQFAATIDELLARFRQPDRLPCLPSEKNDLIADVLEPLIIGRALRAVDDDRDKAGKLFRDSKVDLSEGKADRRRWERYQNEMRGHIDEDLVRRCRGLCE